VKETEGKAGAPIAIKGFVRYALGEGIEKATGDSPPKWPPPSRADAAPPRLAVIVDMT